MTFEEETKKEMKDLSKKMDTILQYLHNDEGTGELGLVAAFKKHETKVNQFITSYETEKAVRNDRIKVVSFVFGGIGTFVTLAVNALVDYYSKKS